MLEDILNIARGVHALYNSDDPDYYRKMGNDPLMGLGSYFGPRQSGFDFRDNPIGTIRVGEQILGGMINGIGGVLNAAVPMARYQRSKNYGMPSRELGYPQRATRYERDYGSPRGGYMPRYTRGYQDDYGDFVEDRMQRRRNGLGNSFAEGRNPVPVRNRRYSFDNPSPQVRDEQQRELNYWNQKKELDHWNGQRDMQNHSLFTPENVGPNMYSQGEDNEDKAFARGGPAKKYYVREKMKGYDVGRAAPYLLANYWNPRLDPMGVAGNAMGAEAARVGTNYGINRLMGTDGYQWSDPRELTSGERFKRFFTHRIPKTINKTFGTNLSTDHNRYWNANKGLPPSIANKPGLLEQGAEHLKNKAADIGNKAYQRVQGLGSAAYDNIIPPIQESALKVYNAMPDVKEAANNATNRTASYFSPFSRSMGGGWELENQSEAGEPSPSEISYLSRMYNSLPDLGLGSVFTRKNFKDHGPYENIRQGMNLEYPEEHTKKHHKSGISASDRFVNQMLEENEPVDFEGDKFFDPRNDSDDNEMYFDAKDHYASGGYLGHLAPDEFVHRRHHRVEQPSNLDEMIKTYIAHMMQQQQN